MALPLTKKYFMAKEVRQYVHIHEIHWFYQVSHNPEAAGLLER